MYHKTHHRGKVEQHWLIVVRLHYNHPTQNIFSLKPRKFRYLSSEIHFIHSSSKYHFSHALRKKWSKLSFALTIYKHPDVNSLTYTEKTDIKQLFCCKVTNIITRFNWPHITIMRVITQQMIKWKKTYLIPSNTITRCFRQYIQLWRTYGRNKL